MSKSSFHIASQTATRSPTLLRTTAVCLPAITFMALTVGYQQGYLAGIDLHLVRSALAARHLQTLVAGRQAMEFFDEPRVLLVLPLTLLVLLWWSGYRRTWVLLIIWISWPVELGLKAWIAQPSALSTAADLASSTSTLHGAPISATTTWLRQVAIPPVGSLLPIFNSSTVTLSSGYPSGTMARGTYLLGLVVWALLGVPLRELMRRLLGRHLAASPARWLFTVKIVLVVALLALVCVFGLAIVLYAWHWPSEVLGGALLGLALLAATLAILRHPRSSESMDAQDGSSREDGVSVGRS